MNSYGKSLEFRDTNRIRYKLHFFVGVLKEESASTTKVLKLFLESTS